MATPDVLNRYRAPLTEGMQQAIAKQNPNLRSQIGYYFGLTTKEGEPIANPQLPGKLLRPTLLLVTYEGLGREGKFQRALPFALALEMTHNFSLVHDDIMDADDMRHGRETLHKAFNLARAINAGDALNNMADEAMDEASFRPRKMEEARAFVTGTRRRLLEGQDEDIQFEGRTDISLDDYDAMISGKTGAMIEAPIVLGAKLQGKRGRELTQFMLLGRLMGIAFQMQDDLLGIWGDGSKTGKSTTSDITKRKNAFPAVWALTKARDPHTPDSPEKQRILAFYEGKGEVSEAEAQEMKDVLERFGAKAATLQRIDEYHDRIMHTLGEMHVPVRLLKAYIDIADFFATRNH